MNKKIILGIIATIVLIGGYFFPQGHTVVNQVTEKVSDGLGAVATLDGVDNPYMNINGNKSANYGRSVTATSSVLCSVKNLFPGTSTIQSIRLGVSSVGGLGAQVLDFATSTSPFASGSTYGSSTPALLANFKTPATAFAAVWFPTTTGVYPQVGPGEYVNIRIATATPSAFTTYYTGNCSIQFLAI